jgi:hypothetical protein
LLTVLTSNFKLKMSFLFGCIDVWTQGHTRTKQVLFHLSHSISTFLCWVFPI